jgi:hypothetical protein
MSDELRALKDRVSAAVLKQVKGVCGVGLPAQKLTVYLEQDTPEIRAAVAHAIKPLNLPVEVQCVVMGKIEPRK